MPDFALERRLAEEHGGGLPVVGIDEVGMGALAGPMVVAGVVINSHPDRGWFRQVKDSKKLTPARRRTLYSEILRAAEGVYVSSATNREIDEIGLVAAHNRLILAVYQQATLSFRGEKVGAIVDGSQYRHLGPALGPSVFMDKADDKSVSVACASIVAKVLRDDQMVALAGDHPGYGFERNKGYPTEEHRNALNELGPSDVHRYSYEPVRAASIVKKLNDGRDGMAYRW